ncbi:MAG: metallopeptidase family protein [Pirellulaceae bacterium]
MKRQLRDLFDQHLESVLGQLPERVDQLLDEVPLVVEDHPSREIMQKMGVRRRDRLCGLYTGIPLTQRSVEHSGVLPDVIHIYREGILSLALDRQGRISEEELKRQIRITVLHEVGHHHGLDEDELRELGY